MRDLVQQDCEGGDGANRRTHEEWRSHCQAVGEIMDEVSCQVQVTRHLDVCVSRETKGIKGVHPAVFNQPPSNGSFPLNHLISTQFGSTLHGLISDRRFWSSA